MEDYNQHRLATGERRVFLPLHYPASSLILRLIANFVREINKHPFFSF